MVKIFYTVTRGRSRDPLVEDPYESETVFVSASRVSGDAGEGLFARRDISKGQLVALFNGVRRLEQSLNQAETVVVVVKILLEQLIFGKLMVQLNLKLQMLVHI